jgi:hypothetical protein
VTSSKIGGNEWSIYLLNELSPPMGLGSHFDPGCSTSYYVVPVHLAHRKSDPVFSVYKQGKTGDGREKYLRKTRDSQSKIHLSSAYTTSIYLRKQLISPIHLPTGSYIPLPHSLSLTERKKKGKQKRLPETRRGHIRPTCHAALAQPTPGKHGQKEEIS